MPLKNIGKANPKLTHWWMEIEAQGCTQVGWPDKQSATNVRSQLSTLRSLAATQAPSLYDITKDIQLTVQLHSANNWVIVGRKPQPLTAIASSPPARALDVIERYVPSEHHHNPTGLTPTGIPMVMPEALPIQLTDEQMKEIERAETRARDEEMLRKLGFDKPLKRND